MEDKFIGNMATWAPLPTHSTPSVPWGVLPTWQPSFKNMAGLFLMISLNIVALVANSIVLIAVVKAPNFRRFMFVGQLCAVDLLGAALLMPLGIVSCSPGFSGMAFTTLECRVYILLNVVFVSASTLTITAISMERYYYIVYPMHYEERMTMTLIAGAIALVWSASVALGLSTVFSEVTPGALTSVGSAHCSSYWQDQRSVFSVLFGVVCFCFPAAVILAVYCNVYRVARLAARRHIPLPLWTNSQSKQRCNSVNSHTAIITSRDNPRRIPPLRGSGGGKAAMTVLLIVGQFLVCWLPYFAFHLHLSLDAAQHIPKDVEEAVTWLAYSSFTFNPFFYGLLNQQIRDEIWKLGRCCLARPTDLNSSSHDGSGPENFMQFLERTSCATSSGRNTQTSGFKIPGQIPEDLS